MLLDGQIPADMKPKQVYLTYLHFLPEFQPFQNYTALNFANKLGSARKRATKKVDRAEEDLTFLEHDRLIFPEPTLDTKNQPIWKGSEAQKLLRKTLSDISSGRKAYVKPRFLYAEKEEWHENYSLEFFRKKIYQEVKFDKWQAWLKEKFSATIEEEDGEDKDQDKDQDES